MPELTLRLYDVGNTPLRTERLTVADDPAAVEVARLRLRSSRFKGATIHVDGAFLVRLGPDGFPCGARDGDTSVPLSADFRHEIAASPAPWSLAPNPDRVRA